MRKSKQHEYRQAYNAQAVVDADGSQLVLGARVTTNVNDRRELVADVDAIPASVGTATGVLADKGYATGGEVVQLQQRGMEVLVATTTGGLPPVGTAPGATEAGSRGVGCSHAQEDGGSTVRATAVSRPCTGSSSPAVCRGIEKVQGESCWPTTETPHNLART